jgi:flagellar FliJ protein
VFRFSLQRILELRAKREQEIAVKLSEAQSQAEDARQACEALQMARDAGQARWFQAHAANRTVGQMQNLSYVLERLDHCIAQANDSARTAEERAQQVANDLTAASQERRVLDRLRERRLEEWRVGELQLDRQTMDEIALARYHQSGATQPGAAAHPDAAPRDEDT